MSWQNAFWSLTALALNAMAQVSTADGNDAEIPFSPWRSSPLVCFAEIIVMLMWAVVGFYHGNGLRDCLTLSRQRMLSEKKRGFDADGPSSFMALILFVLVPLPQILKIMWSTGIPWTKAWAMAYFLVSVLTFPVVEERSEHDPWQLPQPVETKLINISDWLYMLCLATYVTSWAIWWAWISWTVFLDQSSWWSWPFWLPLGFMYFLGGTFALPFGIAMYGAVLVDVMSRCTHTLRGERFTSVIWSERGRAKVVEAGPWNRSVLWSLGFALFHLIACLGWYSSFYNASGTTKPPWAESLG